jgi:hypothetical protein
VLVGLTTLLQRLTPPEVQGRVYAAADAVITTPQTISVAVGTALIGIVRMSRAAGGDGREQPRDRRVPDPAVS